MIVRPAAPVPSWLTVAVAAVMAFGVGAAIVVTPAAAALAVIVGGVMVLASRSLASVERAMSVGLLAGALILGYGFANLGLRGGVPIPLAELLLIPLVLFAIADQRARLGSAAVPILLFAGVVMARLVVDYGEHGTDAIRDATLAIEILAAFVGARAIARDGVARWIRWLGPIMFIVICYASLYPVRDALVALSPTVGLQRAVPLVGSFAGVAFAVVAAGLFFAALARGWPRVILFGWALAAALIHQQRSLYLLIPAAILALGWAQRRSFRMIGLTAAALALGAVALAWVVPSEVEGRIGPTTPAFVVEHARTLLGDEGPGAGTIDDRARWAERTLGAWSSSPATVIGGVGLGPDLTFGFRKKGDIAVRKPHNDFLEVLARTGVLGFGLFIWILVALVRPVVRCARAGGPHARFCAWVAATSLVYLGVAAVQPVLAFPYGTIPLFMFLGMGWAASREGRHP